MCTAFVSSAPRLATVMVLDPLDSLFSPGAGISFCFQWPHDVPAYVGLYCLLIVRLDWTGEVQRLSDYANWSSVSDEIGIRADLTYRRIVFFDTEWIAYLWVVPCWHS